MSRTKELISMELKKGIIVEKIDNANFIVEDLADASAHLTMYISAKMRMIFIALNVGDVVYMEVTPLNDKKGRYVSDLQAAKYHPEAKRQLDNPES